MTEDSAEARREEVRRTCRTLARFSRLFINSFGIAAKALDISPLKRARECRYATNPGVKRRSSNPLGKLRERGCRTRFS